VHLFRDSRFRQTKAFRVSRFRQTKVSRTNPAGSIRGMRRNRFPKTRRSLPLFK
jgi:hypothetical protein